MIVLIGGEKGGTGKTTIATNLAAIRAGKGHDVLLVDTDKQGSASAWSGIRDIKQKNAHIPNVPNIQKFGANLPDVLKDLQKRYEDILIDAGGRDSVELRAAMTVAEKLFVPVQASQFDIWTLSIISDLVAQAKAFNPALVPKVIINRAATNPSIHEVDEAKDVLREFEHLELSPNIIRERISYRKAAKEGLSVTELEKVDTKSISEIMAIYEEVFYE